MLQLVFLFSTRIGGPVELAKDAPTWEKAYQWVKDIESSVTWVQTLYLYAQRVWKVKHQRDVCDVSLASTARNYQEDCCRSQVLPIF
jgi:hypothetical protein